jgi:hypothetical protein
VVLLALCGGGSYTVYKLASNDSNKKTTADPTATASATASSGASTQPSTRTTAPSRTPTTTAPPAAAGSDPDLFVKGDCFLNEGTPEAPEVRKVACTTAKSYEVLVKINFTTDDKQCDTAPPRGAGKSKWTASYVMDKTPGTSGDYVLCLKKH